MYYLQCAKIGIFSRTTQLSIDIFVFYLPLSAKFRKTVVDKKTNGGHSVQ